MAQASGIPLGQCPTCLSTEFHIDPDTYARESGTYKYRGEIHECDCQIQMDLRRHYLLAGIGDQYQRLNWDDFRGSDSARRGIASALENWNSYKLNGMGLEFSSPNLGVGKTFAATHLGKELVKRGESVKFIHMRSAVRTLIEDREAERELRDAAVLIIDEIGVGISTAQSALFADTFEDLIRYRTDFNRVNITTTNLAPSELHDAYPRVYSLLAAKQDRIEMTGSDARQSFIEMENIELVANGEVRPIT